MESQEYDIVSEDYVLVGHNSRLAKSELSKREKIGHKPLGLSTWEDYMLFGPRWFSHWHCGVSQLIYADANQKDPEHRRSVRDIEAMKPWVTEAEKETKYAKHSLLDYIRQDYAATRNESGSETEGEDDEKTVKDGDTTGKDDDKTDEELSDEEALEFAYKRTSLGHVDDSLVDFILELENPSTKREVLRILSHQMMMSKPRPVMILIALLESMKPNEGTNKSGWAVGYDVIENKILIKSFECKADEHPLAEPWYSDSAIDAFYVAESPDTFASNLISSKQTELPGDDEHYRSVITCMAGKWIEWHSLALKLSDEKSENLRQALTAIEFRLEEEKITETTKPKPVKFNAAQQKCIELRWMLIESEDYMRDVAVLAKEEGHETSANNLAKHFEKVLKDLNQMIESPNTPLEG